MLVIFQNIIRFWLEKGVDGFRVDAVPHLCEDERLLDEPVTGTTKDPNNYGYTDKIYTTHLPRTYEMVLGWRQVLDEFPQPKFMMIEAYANISMTMKYYRYGAHYPFNFGLITNVGKDSKSADFKNLIDTWMTNMPDGAIANWVVSFEPIQSTHFWRFPIYYFVISFSLIPFRVTRKIIIL